MHAYNLAANTKFQYMIMMIMIMILLVTSLQSDSSFTSYMKLNRAVFK